jgi:hypothetical protein
LPEIKTEMKRYPICFSVYLFDVRRFTASI